MFETKQAAEFHLSQAIFLTSMMTTSQNRDPYMSPIPKCEYRTNIFSLSN